VRLESGGRDDLDHLEIPRVLQLAVPDARRLVEAAAGLHQHFAHALVLEQHPAPEHVHELQRAVVQMPLAVRRLSRPGADHVSDHLASRRPLDAQVAILEIASETSFFERRILQVSNTESRAVHERRILR